MKKVLSAFAFMALVVVGLALPAPASADPTDDCRSVAVSLEGREDTGTGGHVWAKDTMTRTLTVCRESGEPVDGKASYRGTVVDKGTFVTQAGKTPRGEDGLVAGITGIVNGGFRTGVFTADLWAEDFKLTAPAASTTSGAWVSTAFPGAEGAGIGSYRWAYATTCETYVDNGGTYTGDITSKCVTTKAPTLTEPACGKAAEASVPNVVGVLYKVNAPKDGKIVVTAKAKPGYALTKDSETRWVLKVPAVKACPTPEPTPTDEPSETPSATPTPTTSATGTPTGSSSPTSTMSPVGGAVGGGSDDGTLPKTGVKALTMFGVGGLLVAVGGITLVLMRRRRDEPGAHREDGDTQVMPAI